MSAAGRLDTSERTDRPESQTPPSGRSRSAGASTRVLHARCVTLRASLAWPRLQTNLRLKLQRHIRAGAPSQKSLRRFTREACGNFKHLDSSTKLLCPTVLVGHLKSDRQACPQTTPPYVGTNTPLVGSRLLRKPWTRDQPLYRYAGLHHPLDHLHAGRRPPAERRCVRVAQSWPSYSAACAYFEASRHRGRTGSPYRTGRTKSSAQLVSACQSAACYCSRLRTLVRRSSPALHGGGIRAIFSCCTLYAGAQAFIKITGQQFTTEQCTPFVFTG